MKNKFLMALVSVMTMLALSSCKEDDPTPAPPVTYGEFHLDMEYIWAMSLAKFELNTPLFHPMSGDSMTFSSFKHYISNIRLKRSNGTYWAAKESYHLLDASDTGTLDIRFTDVPAGDYVALEITFGVDSTRNVSGAQTGDLDPDKGMFWNAMAGYIMIKAEGTSPQSPSGMFMYNLGGFSGENSVVSVREISFPNSGVLSIKPGSTPVIQLQGNPARLFHNYGSVSNGAEIDAPCTDAKTMARDFNYSVKLLNIH
ncbi:MAG TPA: hypothetical protein DIW47_00790 [Bacteroidetes bacterium]|nr:hypothetical protein [Bacteroidota bacterium]